MAISNALALSLCLSVAPCTPREVADYVAFERNCTALAKCLRLSESAVTPIFDTLSCTLSRRDGIVVIRTSEPEAALSVCKMRREGRK